MKAAIYARYSSDHQRDNSIEDQVRSCRKSLEQEGWSEVAIFTDQAISGASVHRPGYQQMMREAQSGKFNVVIAEALDRLSRDQEDIAALYKQLSFAGIQIITLSEGEINELHVGLKGTMNALFLKDLAHKTRRGLEGRVRQGKSGGGLAFGYSVVKAVDQNGDPVRGDRTINEAEAATVRLIFEQYAKGHSPRAIAKQLNDQGIPGPLGRVWQDTTIRGHATRRTGILRNDLYRGRLVWNKQHYIKDPKTGKRLARPNPEEQWIIEEVPELRIIDDTLWLAVEQRLDGIRQSEAVSKARKTKFWEHRRKKHLLTGLVNCLECHGPLSSAGKDYLACSTARRTGICSNRKGVRRGLIEEAVLDCFKERLMAPELVQLFIEEFHTEVNKQSAVLASAVDDQKRQLDKLNSQIDGLYDAIADGLRTTGLKTKLEALEDDAAKLQAQIDTAPSPAPILHPNLAALYRRKVANLHAALNNLDTRVEAAAILRSLVERVEVSHQEDGTLYLSITGDIVSMINTAASEQHKGSAPSSEVPAPYHSSVKVVAGVGFEPTTFRL